jgi:hypothetical protein
MNRQMKYSLSFTAASFRLHDFLRVANSFKDYTGEIDIRKVNSEEVLSKGNQKTSNREMAEFIKRYNSLTTPQKQLLIDGTLDEQKIITLLAIVKSNSFIRDFVIEVVRDKFLIFDFQLTEGDFKSFLNRKSELHPELEAFAEGTIYKAKQTMFKILADSGLIDNIRSRMLIKIWLSPNVVKVIFDDNPEFLKAFLFSDADIKQELLK